MYSQSRQLTNLKACDAGGSGPADHCAGVSDDANSSVPQRPISGGESSQPVCSVLPSQCACERKRETSASLTWSRQRRVPAFATPICATNSRKRQLLVRSVHPTKRRGEKPQRTGGGGTSLVGTAPHKHHASGTWPGVFPPDGRRRDDGAACGKGKRDGPLLSERECNAPSAFRRLAWICACLPWLRLLLFASSPHSVPLLSHPFSCPSIETESSEACSRERRPGLCCSTKPKSRGSGPSPSILLRACIPGLKKSLPGPLSSRNTALPLLRTPAPEPRIIGF